MKKWDAIRIQDKHRKREKSRRAWDSRRRNLTWLYMGLSIYTLNFEL